MNSHILSRAQDTIKDCSHSGHHLFELLPSARHYQSIKSRTTRLSNSPPPPRNAVFSLNKDSSIMVLPYLYLPPSSGTWWYLIHFMYIICYIRCECVFIYFKVPHRSTTSNFILMTSTMTPYRSDNTHFRWIKPQLPSVPSLLSHHVRTCKTLLTSLIIWLTKWKGFLQVSTEC